GQMGAEAAMHAAAEAEMPVGVAVEADLEGIGNAGGIDVRRAEADRHEIARRVRATAELTVGGGLPHDAGHWRLPPEQLLDDRGDDRGILDELVPAVGLLRQVGEE